MIDYIQAFVLPAAYALLPPVMRSPEATALLLAIGRQESRFLMRRQIGGPARGFWQFEVGGVQGVMEHEATMYPIAKALSAMRYDHTADPAVVQGWLEHNDILAACFARCLLCTLPEALPALGNTNAAWTTYIRAWRPGKPHRDLWTANYATAYTLATQPIDRSMRLA